MKKILLVLVVYKETIAQTRSYQSISMALRPGLFSHGYYIHDNSPEAQSVDSSMHYVHSPTNVGVSQAYNDAADYALREGYDWMLLMDQDSLWPIDFFEKWADALQENPEIRLFAPRVQLDNGKPFSPIVYQRPRNYAIGDKIGRLPLSHYAAINSGLLVDTHSFLAVGGYNPKVWLDFADFQFFERFRTQHEYFVVFDSLVRQDFSMDETDIQKIKFRFRIFCECARHCQKRRWSERWYYFNLVGRHTARLMLTHRTLVFLPVFLRHYLFAR